MNVFKLSIVLTKRHTRYGGDSDSLLGLVLNHKGVLYLYSDSEPQSDYGMNRMFPITSCPVYTQWLVDNYMDLLMMLEDEYPHDWYNDRTIVGGRKLEFKAILDKL